MATLAPMSHDSSIDDNHIETSFTFDSDHGLDLSLDDFPVQDSRHLSFVSVTEETEARPHSQEVQVPTHPIPSMQAAFAESMLDAFDGSVPAPTASEGGVVMRRKLLLEQDISEETYAARWKQKPGQRYHELWKLMSQISFGIYLLLGGLAREDDLALTILQGHVDEVDLFLEMTLEDFNLAQDDIDDRLKNLKLPLQNRHIFEGMLEDRDFRNQIVSGNETIEHIITRTASAMNDALKNVQHGMAATKEFATYMAEEQNRMEWQTERPEMIQVFEAMKGNADGWYKAYISLQTRESILGNSLVQLGTIVAEIDKLAADISRKTRFSVTTSWKGSSNSPVASTPQPTHLSVRRSRSSMRLGPQSRPSTISTMRLDPHSRPSTISTMRLDPHSRPSAISSGKEFTEAPAMITPANRATLPVFQLVTELEEPAERNGDSNSHYTKSNYSKSNYTKSNYSMSVYSNPDKPDTEFEEPPLPTLSSRTYTPPPLTPRTYSPAPQPSIRSQTPESELETSPPLTPRAYSPAPQFSTRSLTPEPELETSPPPTPRAYSPAPQVSVRSLTPEPERETPQLLTPRTYSPASQFSANSHTPEPELESLTPRTYSPAPQISIRSHTPESEVESPPTLIPRTYSPASQFSIHSHTPEPELESPPTLIPRTYSPASQLSIHSHTPEPELESPPTLIPRTYSLASQFSAHSHTPEPEPESPPELTRRSSLRHRLSSSKPDPPPLLSSKSYTSITSRSSNRNSPTSSNSQPQQRSPSHTIFPRPSAQTTTSHDRKSPPNQNLAADSAYYSDTSRIVSVADTPSHEYHQFIAASQPQTRHDFGSTHISTPRSDQQHFQPVQASPHSPLQRPWTAAPSERGPPGVFNGYSSSTNGGNGYSGNGYSSSTIGGNGYSGNGYSSSTIGGGGGRDSRTLGVLSSNMSQVTRASEVTVGLDAQGKKIKKKRSGFGWLKKAFSLSEEEKREFEEARRRTDDGYAQQQQQQRERVFLDGRRLQR